jgi:bacteriocin-like protein
MEDKVLVEPVELTDEQLEQVTGGVPSVNQQATPPGQFPGGNPSTANGQSNTPGNSG